MRKDLIKEQLPVYDDPSGSGFTSIFVTLPIEYIFHDAELNPRPISEKYAKEGKILWCKIDEEEWKQIEKMVTRIINHKLWEAKDPIVVEAIGTTKKDIAEKLLTEGKVGEQKVFEPPINSSYVLDIRL